MRRYECEPGERAGDESWKESRSTTAPVPRLRQKRTALGGRFAVVDCFQVAHKPQVAVSKIARHRGHSAGQRRQRPKHENRRTLLRALFFLWTIRRKGIDFQITLRHPPHAVLTFGPLSGGVPQRNPQGFVRCHLEHGAGQLIGGRRRNEQAVHIPANHFRHGPDLGRYDRQARGHRFEQDHGQAFFAAAQHEGIGRRIERRSVGPVSQKPDVAVEVQLLRLGQERGLIFFVRRSSAINTENGLPSASRSAAAASSRSSNPFSGFTFPTAAKTNVLSCNSNDRRSLRRSSSLRSTVRNAVVDSLDLRLSSPAGAAYSWAAG